MDLDLIPRLETALEQSLDRPSDFFLGTVGFTLISQGGEVFSQLFKKMRKANRGWDVSVGGELEDGKKEPGIIDRTFKDGFERERDEEIGVSGISSRLVGIYFGPSKHTPSLGHGNGIIVPVYTFEVPSGTEFKCKEDELMPSACVPLSRLKDHPDLVPHYRPLAQKLHHLGPDECIVSYVAKESVMRADQFRQEITVREQKTILVGRSSLEKTISTFEQKRAAKLQIKI